MDATARPVSLHSAVLCGVGLPLSQSKSKVKPTGRGRGWKTHLVMALFFPEHLERPTR